MKIKDLQASVQMYIANSIPFIICEVRGHKVETIKYVDKKSGKAAEFSLLVYNCDDVSEASSRVIVQQNVTEEDVKAGVIAQFKKGDYIVVPCQQITETKGIRTVGLFRDKPIEYYQQGAA